MPRVLPQLTTTCNGALPLPHLSPLPEASTSIRRLLAGAPTATYDSATFPLPLPIFREAPSTMGLFDKLKQGLQKTKQLLQTDVRDLFKPGEILDEAKLERFESKLIQTDMGIEAAGQIVGELRRNYLGRTVVIDDVWATVKVTLKSILKVDGGHWDPADPVSPLNLAAAGPTVILVSGVNGSGKTTSISKLAKLLQDAKKKVILAAGDTFRAAAVEQLTLWSQRLGCEIVTQPGGSDPASVAHIGCERALASGAGCLIVDTAGRLQTPKNLVGPLGKS